MGAGSGIIRFWDSKVRPRLSKEAKERAQRQLRNKRHKTQIKRHYLPKNGQINIVMFAEDWYLLKLQTELHETDTHQWLQRLVNEALRERVIKAALKSGLLWEGSEEDPMVFNPAGGTWSKTCRYLSRGVIRKIGEEWVPEFEETPLLKIACKELGLEGVDRWTTRRRLTHFDWRQERKLYLYKEKLKLPISKIMRLVVRQISQSQTRYDITRNGLRCEPMPLKRILEQYPVSRLDQEIEIRVEAEFAEIVKRNRLEFQQKKAEAAKAKQKERKLKARSGDG